MIKYKPEQYRDILDKLPQEVRNVVVSMDTTNHLWKIGEKHNLQIDKVGMMHDISMDTMMGIVSTKDFVKELTESLNLSSLEASNLARDIDENVFRPIKQTMISLYANGAPNRPSSSLVQYYEEDESHPSLDKDAILSEIEKPVESPVKKEIVAQTVGKLVSEQVIKEISKQIPTNQLTGSPTCPPSTEPAGDDRRANKLDIYHEELEKSGSKETKNEPSNPLSNSQPQHLDTDKLTTSPTNKLAESDLLNKIAGMKLSKTFVMPRGEEADQLKSLEVSASSLEGSRSAKVTTNTPKQIINNTNPIKPETNNIPESPKTASTAIDPYREKI
jgi:hypothetical protein